MRVETLGPEPSYHTRLLTPEDLDDLQALLERAGDYFQIVTGRPPAKDEARRAFVAGPPAKAVNDKRVIGLYDVPGELVGVLDAITDWPEQGVWTMGMLLLDPAFRGRGVGSALLQAYEEWARSEGAMAFRTAVVAHHEPGLTFLERAGYEPESDLPDYDAGGRRARVIFLAKR
ncbi:MAG: N-acetyltransferase [Gemmatimonadetes bacterium]|nr:N-acetyltransferase [Gemmatimonadota bacterium]